MVSVVKRKKGNSTFYYLKHNTSTKQKEIYLGKKIPDDLEERKKRFLLDFYREEWIPKLEIIHKIYQDEIKRTPKQAIRKNIEAFEVLFTYNTQRIEGSTLTFRDTVDLLVHGITPSRKPEQDMVEAKLHQQVFNEMLKREKSLSLKTVNYWHTKMFNKTKPQFAGQIREYAIYVKGSRAKFPKWEDVLKLLDDFFVWYKKIREKINPVEIAGLAHIRFTTIHPYCDGNGRIARLITNYILDNFGYPLLDIKFTDRMPYYRAQEKAQLQNNEVYFLQWFIKYYLNSHRKFW